MESGTKRATFLSRDVLHIVLLQFQAVASKLHNTEVEVEVVQRKSSTCDHVQFAIIDRNASKNQTEEEKDEIETLSMENKISPATFCRAFPFHIMFDRNHLVCQAGTSVARILPALTQPNCMVTDLFTMVRPHVDFTFHNILAHINTVFVLKTKDQENADKRYVCLGLAITWTEMSKSITNYK